MGYFAYIIPFLFFYILPRLQCIYTLIIGVFLYIEETLFFLLYFAPEMCIFYIQCFPYSKNNTFLSIHFFCILPRLQCMFFLYIWKLDIFPEKYVFYYIYRRKTLFFLYILSRYILYICIFPIYIGQLFGLPRLLVFLLYIETISFSLAFPQPIVFLYKCFYIQHCLDYGIFLIYIGKYCPFFSYISCHNIPYRCFYIYKH